MPACWKPSSRAHSLMEAARAGRSRWRCGHGRETGAVQGKVGIILPELPLESTHVRIPFQLAVAVVRAAQVRELDARLIAAGTPGSELMQRAAHGRLACLAPPLAAGCASVSVLAGPGNNAGDGYLVAALAQRAGWQVQVLAVGGGQGCAMRRRGVCRGLRAGCAGAALARRGRAGRSAGRCHARHRAGGRVREPYAAAIGADQRQRPAGAGAGYPALRAVCRHWRGAWAWRCRPI